MIIRVAPTAPIFGLFPIINCMIHFIMYSYYALATLGPQVQKYLWWKKYITQLQLAQFVILIMYLPLFLYNQTGYPLGIWVYVGTPQPFLFLYLFWSFYKSSYYNNKEKTKDLGSNYNNNYEDDYTFDKNARVNADGANGPRVKFDGSNVGGVNVSDVYDGDANPSGLNVGNANFGGACDEGVNVGGPNFGAANASGVNIAFRGKSIGINHVKGVNHDSLK